MSPPPNLAEALEFDATELAANRAGQLSPRQRERLLHWGRTAWQRALLIFLIAVIAASAAIFWGIRQDFIPLIWLGIAISLLNACFTGLAGRYQLRLRVDIYGDDSVVALEGEVSRVIQPIGRVRLRSLRVAGRNLPLSERAFAAIHHQQPYRLYLTRSTSYLLAAEPLATN